MRPRAKSISYAALIGALAGALAVRLSGHMPNGKGSVLGGLDGLVAGFTPYLWASLGLWFAFSIYWEIAATGAAPAERRESSGSRSVHLVLVSIGQLMVFLAIPGLRARFLPASTALAVAALAIQVGFLGLGVWSRLALGRNWSGAIAATQGQELVRDGPYRTLRHPIYTALLGMYACATLISGELHALIGLAILLAAYWRKVRFEEELLASRFGPAYGEYRGATWGAVPGLF